MSGATATTVMAAAAVAGTAYSVYSGERAAKAQKSAQAEAKSAALKQEKAADEAMNAANRKSPNTNAMLDRAANIGKAGPAGTMLTGNTGVDYSNLNLGKSTLLGS
jgi:hypothetical protein